MKMFKRAKGILGMNARNLSYIGKFNSRKSKKFADDKLYTKQYLSSRGVGVAKMFKVIKDHKELVTLDPKSLPSSFVLKPNRGYGGEGIFVIKEKRGKSTFIDVSNEEYSWKDMIRHMISILDGKYAISGLSDQVIIEERLEVAEELKPYTDGGLPDVRVIVFNYVPVVAMLRLPTIESKGKANLHLGAVGVGIDIATGQATYAVQHNKFIRRLPNGERVQDITIPHWEEVLMTAAKAQQVSQIGFLAVDIAMTSTGVKILELNARAGLSVQIANQVALKKRLEKVGDLQVPTPQKGVEISKTLFSPIIIHNKDAELSDKIILGLFEEVEVLNTSYKNIPVMIDAHAEKVLVDKTLTQIDTNAQWMEVRCLDRRFRVPFHITDLSKKPYKIVLAGRYLTDVLIDPTRTKANKKTGQINTLINKRTAEKIIQNVDKKLFQIDRDLNILSCIKPINLNEAKQSFLRNPKISPRFFYKKLEVPCERIRRELAAIPTKIDHPLSTMYSKKREELEDKIQLIEAIDTPQLQRCSERLFGKVDRELYNKALKYIKDNPLRPDDSKLLTHKTVVKRIQLFLKDHKLTRWKLKIQTNMTADIAINKKGSILLRDGVEFTENRLKAVIIHEIGTHVFRLENGRMQPYSIFEIGTAGYLTTEEGLAAYNQKQLGIPMGEKDHWMAFRVIGAYLADSMSFSELFAHMQEEFGIDQESAWKTCLKAKRGLIDTNKKIAFTRDIVYFKGYLQVKEYIEKNGDEGMKKLYQGKISLNDLQYLNDIKMKNPRFLPDYKKALAS